MEQGLSAARTFNIFWYLFSAGAPYDLSERNLFFQLLSFATPAFALFCLAFGRTIKIKTPKNLLMRCFPSVLSSEQTMPLLYLQSIVLAIWQKKQSCDLGVFASFSLLLSHTLSTLMFVP